jgi:uncharacterized protein YndB with AHSA1/START domain
MSERSFNDRHGSLTDGTVLRMQRRLPGPIERVWSYLTDSELRRQWLASGVMDPRPGTSFELVWRNDELSASAAERPAGFAAEARATCRMEEVEAPRRLRFVWPNVGEVTFELESSGNDVLLTLTHRRLNGEQLVLDVCAGWHAHLGRLVAHVEGKAPPSLWSTWKKLRAEYQELLVDGVKR